MAIIAVLLAAVLTGMGRPAGAACLPDPERPVLVVDDSPLMRRLLNITLNQTGIDGGRIQEVGDGPGALQMLRRASYGLAVVVWDMSPMTGLQLLQEIRKDPGLAALPVLVVLSYAGPVAAALAAGATGCLVKPFNADGMRQKLAGIFCPLQGADLSKANLQGKDLSRADLQGANLRGANLRGANLSNANLRDAKGFETANIAGAIFSDTVLPDGKVFVKGQTDVARAKAGHKYLTYANLANADLSNADLTSAYLNNANLSEANLRKSNLRGANLNGTNLTGAIFKDTIMPDGSIRLPTPDVQKAREGEKDLRNANLQGADLSNVNLQGANLSNASLTGANLNKANLQGANLGNANLSRATGLETADIKGATFSNGTVMPDGKGWVKSDYRLLRLLPYDVPPENPLQVAAADGRTSPIPDLRGAAPHKAVQYWGDTNADSYLASSSMLGAITLFQGGGSLGAGSCPQGSAPADGRLLEIRRNQPLSAILGNRFGGDGRSTFAVPDLRRAVPHPAMQYCVSLSGLFPVFDRYCGEDYLMGGIFLFPRSDDCPCNAIEADGRLLSISQYSPLYALLGNRFGGDGRSTFAVPDLRRAVPHPMMKYCLFPYGQWPR